MGSAAFDESFTSTGSHVAEAGMVEAKGKNVVGTAVKSSGAEYKSENDFELHRQVNFDFSFNNVGSGTKVSNWLGQWFDLSAMWNFCGFFNAKNHAAAASKAASADCSKTFTRGTELPPRTTMPATAGPLTTSNPRARRM
jgi:hypothetical protein